jgi:hypothetical protein
MHKGFAVSIAIVLLLISGAFADQGTEQEQQFVITAANYGALEGAGVGTVSSFNIVPLANIQSTTVESGNIQYVQTSIGSLFQGANATGFLGAYGFDQGALTTGNQLQGSPSYFILGSQNQDFGYNFSQDTFNIGGFGSAAAIENFVGNQNQFIVTPYGVSANVQILGFGLFDGNDSRITNLVSRGLNIEHISRLRY